MPSEILDVLKELGSFLGATLGAMSGIFLKERLDQKRLRDKEKQTRWWPLLRATEDFQQRLDELTLIYRKEPLERTWGNYKGKDTHDSSHPLPNDEKSLPSEARDFHELYLLDRDAKPIKNFQALPVNSSEVREKESVVHAVRIRIHELNRATTSLYRAAKYLGYAQRVRRELEHGQLRIRGRLKTRAKAEKEIIEQLVSVKKKLNGVSGAGIIDDLQDLIGESVWGQDDSVISYYEFRERLLREAGWEQFTDLFRFFVHFHLKMDAEVKETKAALKELRNALASVV